MGIPRPVSYLRVFWSVACKKWMILQLLNKLSGKNEPQKLFPKTSFVRRIYNLIDSGWDFDGIFSVYTVWANIATRGGVLNFGLGRGVPLGFLKCHPSMYPFWRKSDPSMYQKSKFFAEICAILEQISENFKKLTNQSTKFAPFWRKF